MPLQAKTQPARRPWEPPAEGSPILRNTEEDLDFSFSAASTASRLATVSTQLQ